MAEGLAASTRATSNSGALSAKEKFDSLRAGLDILRENVRTVVNILKVSPSSPARPGGESFSPARHHFHSEQKTHARFRIHSSPRRLFGLSHVMRWADLSLGPEVASGILGDRDLGAIHG
jgi:hypothetical protein